MLCALCTPQSDKPPLPPQTPEDIFAVIAHKNRVQGAANPRALLSAVPVPESPQQLGGRSLMAPISSMMAAPTATGAAAALIVTADWLRASSNRDRAIEIAAQEVMTDGQAELQVISAKTFCRIPFHQGYLMKFTSSLLRERGSEKQIKN